MTPSTFLEAATGRTIRLVKPGTRRWFEYHCYESDASADAVLWKRTHSRVTVLRAILDDNLLYRVRFADGFEGDVFADELSATKAGWNRPDYTPDAIATVCA